MTAGQQVDAKPVSDGRRVRWTLEQVYSADQTIARIDWLRFTVPLDAVIPVQEWPSLDAAFLDSVGWQGRQLVRDARASGTEAEGSLGVARRGAAFVCEMLGAFDVGSVDDKGQDFYEARCALVADGATVGYVMAGGKSTSQARTVHVNLFGAACLHLRHANYVPLRGWLERVGGWITRADIAVDVFEGADISACLDAYSRGDFDVRGKRPQENMVGAWHSGHSRTFQVGKRETGKCLRVYEKGDQLFGHEAADPWLRYEVEFRSSARVVDLDVLTRPADFFAGAYPFCAALVARLAPHVAPQRIPTFQALKDKTADAAVARVCRWVGATAAPSVAAVLELGGEVLADILKASFGRAPGRFRGFAVADLQRAFRSIGAVPAPTAPFSFSGA